jgi:hypothetical protein
MFDFCYFANAVLVYFLICDPKNEQLFKVCFVFGNGILAASVKAFRNSLVYHKFDYLTCVASHAFPMIIMFHIKWFVMVEQKDLPKEQ